MNKVNTKVTKEINNILKTMGVEFNNLVQDRERYNLRIVSIWEEEYYNAYCGNKKRYYFNFEVTLEKSNRDSPSQIQDRLNYSWNKRGRLVRMNRMRKYNCENLINNFFNGQDVKEYLLCLGFEVARWDFINKITYKEVEKL
jgi:hypothetical protein